MISTPKFVSSVERAELQRLCAELQRLYKVRRGLSAGRLHDKLRLARKKYLADPNQHALADFQEEAAEVNLLSINPAFRRGAIKNLGTFAENELAPLLRSLITRGLELASGRLGEIIVQEDERCRSFTGHSTTFSDVIEAQKRVVGLFERLHSRVANTGHPMFVENCIAAVKELEKCVSDDDPHLNLKKTTSKKLASIKSQKYES